MSVLGRVVVSDFIPANMEISIRLVEEGLPSHVYPQVTSLKARRYPKGHTSLRKKQLSIFASVFVNILGVTFMQVEDAYEHINTVSNMFQLIYISLVLQIPCEKLFRHPKSTPKPLAEGIGASYHTCIHSNIHT